MKRLAHSRLSMNEKLLLLLSAKPSSEVPHSQGKKREELEPKS